MQPPMRDAAESELIVDHKGVYTADLGQIGKGFFELYEFCEQYGLTKEVLDDLPTTYNGDMTFVSKSSIVSDLKNSADITMRQLAMRKAVDAFSKQIGPVLNTIMAGCRCSTETPNDIILIQFVKQTSMDGTN